MDDILDKNNKDVFKSRNKIIAVIIIVINVILMIDHAAMLDPNYFKTKLVPFITPQAAIYTHLLTGIATMLFAISLYSNRISLKTALIWGTLVFTIGNLIGFSL